MDLQLLDSGIMVKPLDAKTKSLEIEFNEGEIVAVGGDDPTYHVGDRVRFERRSGTGFRIDDKPYVILRKDELVAVQNQSQIGALKIEDLLAEIEDAIPDSERWLRTPNSQLGGQVPLELIGTPVEHRLRDLVQIIKYLGVS